MRTALTHNFDASIYTYSDTANVKGYLEQFQLTEGQVEKLELIHSNIIVPLLEKLTKGELYISSGYRCERLNLFVGGKSTSQHQHCEAVDLEYYFNGVECNNVLFEECKKLNFDQLIKEKGTESKPAWIHVSYKEKGNRKQILRIQ